MDTVCQNYKWQLSAYCGNMSYVRKFYTDLFSNYANIVMCVYDHSKPLMVGVTFYLASINNVKEVEEKYKHVCKTKQCYIYNTQVNIPLI
jgi:hypothetical protein